MRRCCAVAWARRSVAAPPETRGYETREVWWAREAWGVRGVQGGHTPLTEASSRACSRASRSGASLSARGASALVCDSARSASSPRALLADEAAALEAAVISEVMQSTPVSVGSGCRLLTSACLGVGVAGRWSVASLAGSAVGSAGRSGGARRNVRGAFCRQNLQRQSHHRHEHSLTLCLRSAWPSSCGRT